MGRYNHDDEEDWEELRDYYGDELRLTNEEYKQAQAEYSLYDEEPGLKDKNKLVREGEDVQYVENVVLELRTGDGSLRKFELLGRFEIYTKTYVALHPIDDQERNTVCFARAWDDEMGQANFAEIEDEKEFKEVWDMFNKLMFPVEGAKDIPGGGVQWDD